MHRYQYSNSLLDAHLPMFDTHSPDSSFFAGSGSLKSNAQQHFYNSHGSHQPLASGSLLGGRPLLSQQADPFLNQSSHSLALPSQFHQGDYVSSTLSQNAAAAAVYPQLVPPSSSLRTVYLGNLPPAITYEQVLDQIHLGMIEHVKIFEDKNCAFVTFLDPQAAQYFVQETLSRPLMIQNRDIKVGWGKNTLLSETLLLAVKNGASRTVTVGNVENLTIEWLDSTFSVFGQIDQIRLLSEKNMATVHLTSITAAIKAVVTLSMDPRWSQCRIQYGKDRCAPQATSTSLLTLPKHLLNQQQASTYLNRGTPQGLLYNSEPSVDHRLPLLAQTSSSSSNPLTGNRTVYLGGIHPDVTTKDLCDVCLCLFFTLL